MYVARPERLSSEQVGRLLALSERLNIQPGPGGSSMTPLGPLASECRGVLGEALPGAWGWAMVVALWPSQQIVAHVDEPLPSTRYHIPMALNDGCWVFHGGTWQQLELGRLYQMDQAVVHGAVNWGATVRLHLLIDQC